MKRILFSIVAVAALALAAQADLTPERAKEAADLIRDFSAKEFAARQAAVEKLIALGADVLPLVKRTLAGTADAEVRLRCGMVIKALDDVEPAPPPKDEGAEAAVQLVDLKTTPEIIAAGGDATITATLRNLGTRVALVEARLAAPPQISVLAPDVAQICFIEPKRDVELKWRVKGDAAGTAQCSVNFDVVSSGRPAAGPPRDVPADHKLALEKTWSGAWESPAGFVYNAELALRVNPNGTVEGNIRWTLAEAPEGRKDYAGKIGQGGVEYFWGLYDPATRLLSFEGYRRDDPKQVLGLDRYRLTLSPALDKLQGITWNHGTWQAKFNLAPKPAP